MNKKKFSKKNDGLIITSLFLFFLFFYMWYIPFIPIRYYDEALWLGQSYFAELFLKRDFNNKLWQSYYSYEQPKLQEYLYGLLIYPKYLEAKKKDRNLDLAKFLISNNFYSIEGRDYFNYKNNLKNFINWGPNDYNYSSQKLIAKYGEDFKKTIDLIFQARKLNALLVAINLIVIYLIISLISNKLVAFLATIFYGFNNLFLTTSLIAHSEALFLLLFNLGLLLLLKMFLKDAKHYKIHLLFGIVAGLTAQTKLNGFLLIIFYNLFFIAKLILDMFRKKLDIFKSNFFHSFIANFTCLFIFISLHPFLYSKPFKNFIYMVKFRYGLSQIQAEYFGPKLYNFFIRIETIYVNFFDKYKGGDNFNSLLFLKLNTAIVSYILIIIFSFGLICFFFEIYRKKEGFQTKAGFLIIFILLNIALGFYLYIDWDRYYNILIIFFIFFQVFGLINILNRLKLIFKRKY